MVTDEENVESTETPVPAFQESLYRNNTKIRRDRADAIIEDAQLIYRREIEDLDLEMNRLKRELENMLDLSPTNAMNLTLATDFDAKGFVGKDIDIGLKIRNLEIKIGIARKRYAFLFGGAV
jgi:hypothetical protein